MYQQLLLNELTQRQARNSRYSLRSFAQSLGLSPGLLSQLISGNRPLTHRSANLLCERLSLSAEEAEEVWRAVPSEARKKSTLLRPPSALALTPEEFKVLSDWEHFAVLALSDVPGNRFESAWIARRLNIPRKRAAEVRDRLEKLGHLEKSGKGFRQTTAPLTTSQDIPSTAIQKYHKQNLEKAGESLFEHTVEERYFGSRTVAIDPKNLPKFKKLLRGLRQKIDELAAEGSPDRVYHFSTQLFPIDKGDL